MTKLQEGYVLLASIIGFGGGMTNHFLWYGILIPPVANIGVGLSILIIFYAVLRYRLLDIKVAFTHAGIFLIVYAFVLGIPFIVEKHTHSGWLSTSLAVVFATIGPLIYRFLQKKADDKILAQQRRYQKVLLQAAMGMVSEHDLKKLVKLIAYILKRTIKLDFAAIFIADRNTKSYSLNSVCAHTDAKTHNLILTDESPFINYLKDNREPFFFEEIPSDIKSSISFSPEIKAVISAFMEEDLLGFVLLGEKLNKQNYTAEDMNVFKILSRQAALAIANCIFYDESKATQQKMFLAEKLASIGGMADGVAHQIKNRLNLFSIASGALKDEILNFNTKHPKEVTDNPELKKSFEYMEKIANSLLDNVKRTDGIIRGILEFSRVENKENFFGKFSLKELIDLSLVLLKIKHEMAELPITSDLGEDDSIFGIKGQMTEVIYNLLDNAYEAIKEKKDKFKLEKKEDFIPLLQLKLEHKDDRNIITITDNGIGVKEEDKFKIFAPFFTTKSSYKSGSGIGAYVVKRIIEENHKGKIWFSSTYMEGTKFFIELPKDANIAL